jgi:hypothetical protein
MGHTSVAMRARRRKSACKRKSAHIFILSRAMNTFSFLILPIMHVYNVGISRLRSEDVTLVVYPTPVGRRDSSRTPDFGRRTQFWSYAQLRSESVTPVICVTPVVCLTLVVCLTPVGRRDSGWNTRLWSHVMTPVAHHGFGRRSYRMTYLLICEKLHMVKLDDYSIL